LTVRSRRRCGRGEGYADGKRRALVLGKKIGDERVSQPKKGPRDLEARGKRGDGDLTLLAKRGIKSRYFLEIREAGGGGEIFSVLIDRTEGGGLLEGGKLDPKEEENLLQKGELKVASPCKSLLTTKTQCPIGKNACGWHGDS